MLVVDEATANIDQATDAVVQRVIRTKFQGCTIVAVAHRLSTVIDCDRIIVLSDGRVVENGHPHQLLLRGHEEREGEQGRGGIGIGGAFASMVDECGPAMAQQLRERAAEAFEATTEQRRLREEQWQRQLRKEKGAALAAAAQAVAQAVVAPVAMEVVTREL